MNKTLSACTQQCNKGGACACMAAKTATIGKHYFAPGTVVSVLEDEYDHFAPSTARSVCEEEYVLEISGTRRQLLFKAALVVLTIFICIVATGYAAGVLGV